MLPLRVTSVHKQFGPRKAVDGVSFSVPAGHVFCLLGPNGAGKTTTLRMCQGLTRPDGGEVRVFDADPARAPPELKRRMGVLPQNFLAFETLTVRENLQYVADIFGADPDIPSLLADLGLAETAKVQFRRLSGGTRRRVGIATALVNDPELVFLDEPTAGVDPSHRRQIWALIEKLRARGRAIVLTTHYMDEAERLSDRIAVIRQGAVVAEGTPQVISRAHGGKLVVRVLGLEGPPPAALLALPGASSTPEGDLVIQLARAQDAPAVLAQLAASGVAYREISMKEPTLDDAFVNLVAKEAAP